MSSHSLLPDEVFIAQFEKCELDPKCFTHEAHLRLAYLYLQKFGTEEAIVKLCRGIARFDRVLGSGDKFHMTSTIASVAVLNHFIRKSNALDFHSLTAEYSQLKTEFKRLLNTHYSPLVLNSPRSKSEFILPDLLADPVFDKVAEVSRDRLAKNFVYPRKSKE
ncbi:MAG: hypothetical protein IPL46_13280 [Saprospiraceae bacterium]|nr:hypothetical protein [Saprospiraceae bacterium]